MNSLKIYSRAGLIICKPNAGPLQVFEAGANLTASNNSTFSDGVDITDAVQSRIVFSGVPYQRIFQEDGSSYGGSRSAVVTALTTLFATRDVDDFLVKDDSSGLTGTTKIRHKADSGGTADRDQGGTLELDTHSASIGLYESFLKINEVDLNNTGGKTQAYGNFLLNLNNPSGTVNCMTINMGNVYQQAVGDFNFATLDISGNVTFSSSTGTVTFSGDTSGIDYADLSNKPTIPGSPLASADQTLTGNRVVNVDGNYLQFKNGTNSRLQYDPNNDRFEFSNGLKVSGDLITTTGGMTSGQVKFQEPAMGGANGVVLRGPTTNFTSDLTFTLPSADGSAGQFLKTDGSGNLSFATAGTGGGMTETPFVSMSGRATFSASDEEERLLIGTSFGWSFYSQSTEMGAWSSSDAVNSTTHSLVAYLRQQSAMMMPSDEKKVRMKVAYRVQNGNSTDFGFSIWSGAVDHNSTASANITLRGTSATQTVDTNSIRAYKKEFTTTSTITDDAVFLTIEQRGGGSGLSTTAYVYYNIHLFLVD